MMMMMVRATRRRLWMGTWMAVMRKGLLRRSGAGGGMGCAGGVQWMRTGRRGCALSIPTWCCREFTFAAFCCSLTTTWETFVLTYRQQPRTAVDL